MTSIVATITQPGRFVYIEPAEVRCKGAYLGKPCRKVLAKELRGSVEIKCPRCGLIYTYKK